MMNFMDRAVLSSWRQCVKIWEFTKFWGPVTETPHSMIGITFFFSMRSTENSFNALVSSFVNEALLNFVLHGCFKHWFFLCNCTANKIGKIFAPTIAYKRNKIKN